MEGRCTTCSGMIHMRNQWGMKLSNLTCNCGGKYERMNSTGKIYGESPNEELSKTRIPYPTWEDQRHYFDTHVNSKKEHFFADYKNKKYIPVQQ